MHIRWRGLELPSVVDCDSNTLTSTYGKFIAEPFERGFGSADDRRDVRCFGVSKCLLVDDADQ